MLRVSVVFVLRALVRSEWRMVRLRVELERTRLANRVDVAPPLIAQQLLVSGEDHRHARHPGFDLFAIGRALWRRVAHGSREGASTIEQQVVRTITGRYERTLRRKLKEILLAILVAQSFPKEILPSVYLQIAYYGWRMNGYQQACQRLGLHPSSLALDEAAGLVARLKYPEPRTAPSTRTLQIGYRTEHLLGLYRRHVHEGNYRHLNGKTVCNRASAHAATEPIPER
ncbi:MAG TPA: biosynthetic peptidoglycan transglycosylase [Candidatus Krumholzibacteria bacterium]|nr:biosynthetic peptidoglycan transglycosylase [Candidatus Krumholzibacteria bacterium]